MQGLKRGCRVVLVVIGAYALAIGIWAHTLKYLGVSGHDVESGRRRLEMFAPTNELAYGLIAVVFAALFILSWRRPER
jgi:hypothetical protein